MCYYHSEAEISSELDYILGKTDARKVIRAPADYILGTTANKTHANETASVRLLQICARLAAPKMGIFTTLLDKASMRTVLNHFAAI